jgi:hypothetical protein
LSTIECQSKETPDDQGNQSKDDCHSDDIAIPVRVL